MRPDRDLYFSDMAALVARRSTCLRRAVGCVLVNGRNHVLATGYNGVPRGQPHCNDIMPEFASKDVTRFTDLDRVTAYPHACPGAFRASGSDLEACFAIHAEQNALLQCPDVDTIATCYSTTAPCITCTKLLLNTSCARIGFLTDYPHAQVAQVLWETSGRIWTCLI